jgi:8-oxo-dGTP diphosphatase
MEEKDTNDSVVIVVKEKDKILLIQRSKTDDWMPLHWSFPGGHIQKNETPYKAAKRELKEETRLDGTITYAGTRKTRNGKMYIYFCDDPKGEVELNYEHVQKKWIEYNDLNELEDKTPYVKEIIATALQIPMGYE